MDDQVVAECGCRALRGTGGVWIDASLCSIARILESFRAIQELVNRKKAVDSRSKSPTSAAPTSHRGVRGQSWAERWERVRGALASSDRVMEEEGIPRSPPTCYACRKALSEGEVRFLHGGCDERRFSDPADVRPLKDYARRELREGSTPREVILALDDEVPKIALGVIAQVILRTLG